MFVPGPAGFQAERAVYQVKRFSENLTSSQERQIKRSYQRVLKAGGDEGWRITEGHLVMPLDLTKHNLPWLGEMTSDADFPVVHMVWRIATRLPPSIPTSSTTTCETERTASPRRSRT